MEIRHLRLVKTVAETKNLTKASRQLFLSQSALSHQLREIESTYKTQVFVRAKKQMLLTQAGTRLLETANIVLQELEKTENDITKLNGEEEGLLRLSTMCYTCYHWLSPTLKKYKQKYPNVQIEILPEATYSTLEYLLNGTLDIALSSEKIDDPNLSFSPLFEDELLVVVSPNSPLAQRRRFLPKDFEGHNFIKCDIPDVHSDILNNYFKPNQVKPKKIIHLRLTEAIIEMVKAEMGISVLSKWSVQQYLDRGELAGIPLAKMDKRTWYAVTLKNLKEPKYQTDFIETLKTEISI
ncbi:LysR family transcriptional regulator [Saprospiraceae bacterium]|jgi:LysR family transcriptional regulator for metE and metH|nr:LysR family transcriptional regulator [Bacteroidota bacterium]MDB4728456.1 LysR family transcriptional regulator [Saprospiraceae bacterium]